MNDLVTVLTFNLPQDAYIIKARLESEGIVCTLKEELTVQVHNSFSNLFCGVKLQVKQSDFKKTIEILKVTGYLKDDDFQKAKYWLTFDKATSNIPFLKIFPIEVRAAIVITPIALILIAIILYIQYPY